MRTLATSVDVGRFRWSPGEAGRAWTLTGALAAAYVAAPVVYPTARWSVVGHHDVVRANQLGCAIESLGL